MGKYFIIFISILSLFLFLSCGTESTPTYTLTTSVVGEGTITPSDGTFEEGEVVTVTSTPSEHWVFNSWSGDGSGTSTSITITMDSDKNVVGNFVEKLYPLNITYVGEGTVTQVLVKSKSEHTFGTVVQLTPVPENGWKFVEWSGDITSTDEQILITVDGVVNVTVTFERIDYPLTITIEGEGTVEQEVVQSKTTDYPYETVVQLTPKPSEGWRFVVWGGDLSGDVNPIQITISEERNVTVIFEQIVYLGDNGITIMCPYGEVGEIGIVDGVEYEVVDRNLLIRRRDRGRDLSNVCVSLVKDMSSIFAGTLDEPNQYNPKIRNWDVSNVTEMYQMFYFSQFNQPIGEWDVSNVNDMGFIFWGSPFNQPIGEWDMSSVNDLEGMFGLSPFNQPIGNWDVSNVVTMRAMFRRSPFNQPIGNWDVSKVNNMASMFSLSQFNQPIGEWDVSNVTDMGGMFRALSSNPTPFNQPIGDWDVSNVMDMGHMFYLSEFNQNISEWCVIQFTSEPNRFSFGSPLTPENKPKWGTCPD